MTHGSVTRATLVDDLETTTRQTGSRRRRRCARARPPRNVARQRRHTPAGTRSAFARISWCSVVNSEIVLVATEATGPALRPVVLLGLARRRGGAGLAQRQMASFVPIASSYPGR